MYYIVKLCRVTVDDQCLLMFLTTANFMAVHDKMGVFTLNRPHAPSIMKEAQIAQFTPHVLCAKTNGQVSVLLSRYIQVHHTRIQD